MPSGRGGRGGFGRGKGGPGGPDSWVGKKIIVIGRGKNKSKVGTVKSETETILQGDFDCSSKTEGIRRVDAMLFVPGEYYKVRSI